MEKNKAMSVFHVQMVDVFQMYVTMFDGGTEGETSLVKFIKKISAAGRRISDVDVIPVQNRMSAASTLADRMERMVLYLAQMGNELLTSSRVSARGGSSHDVDCNVT